MEDLYDPEELILCPYNSAHRIRRCKMSYHLVKCKVHYPDQKMIPCDFNATHRIPEPELQYHHQICPDRKKIEARIVDSRTRSEIKYPIPNLQVESDENWDDLNTPTYDPKQYIENNEIIRHLDVASGAKRRNFRLGERQRINELSSRDNEEARGTQSQERPRENVNLPSHHPVTNVVSSRSQLKEKLRTGANKVFLQFDQN